MTELTGRFALSDFLAYLFPGAAGIGGIYFALRLTWPGNVPLPAKIDLGESALVFVAAYLFGMVLSTLSYPLMSAAAWLLGRFVAQPDPRAEIIPTITESRVRETVASHLGRRVDELGNWSKELFYVARAIVTERSAVHASLAARQNALYKLKQNSLIPLAAWSYAAGVWAYRDLHLPFPLATVLTIVMFVAVTGQVVNRANRNREREAREIYVGIAAIEKGDA